MLAELFLASLIASVAPGRNVALVLALTARFGLRAGLAATCGVFCAKLLWTLAALLMIGGAVGDLVLRGGVVGPLTGSVLIGLGVAGLLSPRARVAPELRPLLRSPRGEAALGLGIALANPITPVFLLAALPQAIPAEGLSPEFGASCAAVIMLSTGLAMAPYLLAGAMLTGRRAAMALRIGSSVLLVLYGAATALGAAG